MRKIGREGRDQRGEDKNGGKGGRQAGYILLVSVRLYVLLFPLMWHLHTILIH
jgi:hypothetical protein